MDALVILDRKKVNIVYTNINNIDWNVKSIIRNELVEEIDYFLEDMINIYDTVLKKSIRIRVKDLLIEKHQLIIDKKLSVILHII